MGSGLHRMLLIWTNTSKPVTRTVLSTLAYQTSLGPLSVVLSGTSLGTVPFILYQTFETNNLVVELSSPLLEMMGELDCGKRQQMASGGQRAALESNKQPKNLPNPSPRTSIWKTESCIGEWLSMYTVC